MFDVWKNVLEEIEQVLPHDAFETWFKDVNLQSIQDDTVIIEVPNVFKEKQLYVLRCCDKMKGENHR